MFQEIYLLMISILKVWVLQILYFELITDNILLSRYYLDSNLGISSQESRNGTTFKEFSRTGMLAAVLLGFLAKNVETHG